MKKEVISYDDLAEEKHKFLDNLLKNSYIDHFTGHFYCKKCKSLVHVDWHRNLAFCKAHIFSRFGITYIEELYKICIKIDGGVDQRS